MMQFNSFKRILVVQDSPELVSMIHDTLQRHGFNASYLESTEEAVSYLETRQPNLLIIDLGLPGVSCWDVVRHARERYELPVIAITGYGENTKRRTGPLEHIDHYLVKPVTPEALIDGVIDVLGLQSAGSG